jgi:hypothetical protein
VSARSEVTAPDGRPWIVRLVWWPRSTFYRDQMAFIDRGNPTLGWGASAALFSVLAKGVVWPIVLLLRVVLRRSWLIEAYPRGQAHFEGFAWRVVGAHRSAEIVERIASGISNGDRSPAPPDARPVAFDRPPERRRFAL